MEGFRAGPGVVPAPVRSFDARDYRLAVLVDHGQHVVVVANGRTLDPAAKLSPALTRALRDLVKAYA